MLLYWLIDGCFAGQLRQNVVPLSRLGNNATGGARPDGNRKIDRTVTKTTVKLGG
jgi:hypothetical protein